MPTPSVTVWRWIRAGKLQDYPVADCLCVFRREVMRIDLKVKKR